MSDRFPKDNRVIEESDEEALRLLAEQQRTEEEIIESESRLKIIFQEAPIGIVTCDNEGNIQSVNKATLDILGSPSEELTKRINLLTFPPLKEIGFSDNLKLCIEDGKTLDDEKPYISKWGKAVVIRYRMVPLYNQDGIIDGALCTMEDYTERKESEKRYRLLAENVTDVIWTVDMNLQFTYISSSVKEILGFTVEEAMVMTLDEVMIPESLDTILAIFAESVAIVERGGVEDTSEIDIEMYRKDGSTVWIGLSKSFIRDIDGSIVGVTGIARDISERKKAEEQVRRSEASLANAQRIAHLGSWEWDIAADKEIWSDETFRIFGVSREVFTPSYQTFLSFIHRDDRQLVEQSVDKALNKGEPYSIDHRIIRLDGTERIVHEEGEVTFDETGQAIHMIGTIHDITERKLAEDAMEFARARAEFFTDLMAHDLNNLHQGIMASLELMLFDPSEQKKYVHSALSQVKRCARLISNVRKFSTVTREVRSTTETDIFPILSSIIKGVKRAFPKREIKVNTNLSEGAFIVMADEFLSDVFFNILHNTVKFTQNDRVAIDVIAKLLEEENFLEIKVSDRGQGIPTEMKKAIFSRLDQKETIGRGMGLTLVNQIVEQYGGRVWAEDRVEGDHTQGTSIVLKLRLS